MVSLEFHEIVWSRLIPLIEFDLQAVDVACSGATSTVIGVRSDGQIVLLSMRKLGGESEAAWRALFDHKRRLKTQSVLPSAETAATSFRAPLESGQIHLHKRVGCKRLTRNDPETAF